MFNFTLKKISKDGVLHALEKAERYRLLNEPMLSESICTDILEADPDNTSAIITLLLSMSDQFGSGTFDDVNRAKQLTARLKEEYLKLYYMGIICERKGRAIILSAIPDVEHIAYDWMHEAMSYYEKAEQIRPAGNDDTLLRWNTCARMIMKYQLEAGNEPYVEPLLE